MSSHEKQAKGWGGEEEEKEGEQKMLTHFCEFLKRAPIVQKAYLVGFE